MTRRESLACCVFSCFLIESPRLLKIFSQSLNPRSTRHTSPAFNSENSWHSLLLRMFDIILASLSTEGCGPDEKNFSVCRNAHHYFHKISFIFDLCKSFFGIPDSHFFPQIDMCRPVLLQLFRDLRCSKELGLNLYYFLYLCGSR